MVAEIVIKLKREAVAHPDASKGVCRRCLTVQSRNT